MEERLGSPSIRRPVEKLSVLCAVSRDGFGLWDGRMHDSLPDESPDPPGTNCLMQSKRHSLVRRETLRVALPGGTPWGWAGQDLVYAALGGPSLFFLSLLRILSE